MNNLMKSFFTLILVGLFVSACQTEISNPENQETNPGSLSKKGGKSCVVIQDGIIMYSATHYLAGQPLTTGYDPFGYNYQAHMFKGSYANAYLGGAGFPPYEGNDDAYLAENPTVVNHWAWPYRNYKIEMKWNDAWLSNKDCDGDGALDRHYGYASYIGSGAWEMYSEKRGGDADYTYKSKIVAVPEDAELISGIWYAADGSVIGPVIWGQFATTQEVGSGGLIYKSDNPGLGLWK